jgi:hypothetical protein
MLDSGAEVCRGNIDTVVYCGSEPGSLSSWRDTNHFYFTPENNRQNWVRLCSERGMESGHLRTLKSRWSHTLARLEFKFESGSRWSCFACFGAGACQTL